MATTAPATLTLEQYLRTSYSPDVDFIDDHTEERHLGEHDHGRLQILIGIALHPYERSCSIRIVAEQRTRVSPSKIRIPDIAILHASAPRDPVAIVPPLVCIEILSPEDRLSRARISLADYLAMGVQNIWLIDPVHRTAYTFGPGGLSAPTEGPLTVPGTEICLDLDPLFADLDGDPA